MGNARKLGKADNQPFAVGQCAVQMYGVIKEEIEASALQRDGIRLTSARCNFKATPVSAVTVLRSRQATSSCQHWKV